MAVRRVERPILGVDRRLKGLDHRRLVPVRFAVLAVADEAEVGKLRRGVAEAQGVIDDCDFIIGTFSKSVGTVGGFCVSNHPKFEIMRLVCRP